VYDSVTCLISIPLNGTAKTWKMDINGHEKLWKMNIKKVLEKVKENALLLFCTQPGCLLCANNLLTTVVTAAVMSVRVD